MLRCSFLFTLTLSDAGSIASLVSLALTGFVAFTVREIRRGVLYKARAPELLKTLTNHRSALNTYLTDYPASLRDFQRQLPAIESTLLTLETKVGWRFSRQRRFIRRVKRLVSQSRG